MSSTCTYRCSYGPLALLLTLALAHDVYDAQAQPQPFRFEHLTVEDGLPDAGVFSILQDHLGFLWLGTGQGLVRYDGYTMEVFQPDANDPHSIGGGTILVLHEDVHGDLWIGTDREGLLHFDRATEQFSRYVHDPEAANSLSHNHIRAIYPDRDGYFWVTSGELWRSSPIEWGSGYLDRFDPRTGHFTRFRHDPDLPGSLSGDDVIDDGVVEGEDGTLWVATWSAGLNRFDRETGRFTHYRHDPTDPSSLSDDRVQAIARDQMGRLWVGTANGLNRFDDANNRFVH